MDYVYDIVLNFQDKYYEFYEWLREDKIINVKKIPIYKITNQEYLSFKYNDISIDTKTLSKQSRMLLVTNGVEVMGLLIDTNGKIIKRSSLIFEESDDILNDCDAIKKSYIKYHLNHIHKPKLISRITENKSHYINNYLKNINKEKDEYFLKYLYYDIYNLELDDIDKIYNDLINMSKKNIPKMYYHLKKVNLELKKQ